MALYSFSIALIAGASHAQTTECIPNNPTMPSAGETCHTTGMDIPNTGGGGRRSPPVDLETCVGGGLGALASGCTMGQIRLAKQVDVDQRAVGGMIASGHCDDALNYALKNGKLDLAERVSGICRNIAAMPAKP